MIEDRDWVIREMTDTMIRGFYGMTWITDIEILTIKYDKDETVYTTVIMTVMI